MNSEITFPESLFDFLNWVKKTTESYWSKLPPEDPIQGAKWLPLEDWQIDELEIKYSIKFGVEHRDFLRVLHTIDKDDCDEIAENADAEDNDFEISEEMKKVRDFWNPPYPPSFFYNWITEKKWIESRLAWVEYLFTGDILGVNRSWLRSWGVRPTSDEEKVRIFRKWFHGAPCLLPITAHTFLMDDGGHGLRPVMSVHGFDTIIAGWSLRHYLLRKFATELGLTATYYDEDDQETYADLAKGIPEIDVLQTIKLEDADIPVWKEVLTYYHNPNQVCWQGFWVPWSRPL